ncbi:hypothetical protein AC622_00785 [Bacillus sp. FJAT-27916]|nr:hypothetical protein AC622_00785 [Bacillus sp. FJAT-27916]
MWIEGPNAFPPDWAALSVGEAALASSPAAERSQTCFLLPQESSPNPAGMDGWRENVRLLKYMD